jgi:hypothetical protein
MGWWNATRDGKSLQNEPTGLVWGDGPADILDDAISRIRHLFRESMGREPFIGELRAGLESALLGRDDQDTADSLENL